MTTKCKGSISGSVGGFDFTLKNVEEAIFEDYDGLAHCFYGLVVYGKRRFHVFYDANKPSKSHPFVLMIERWYNLSKEEYEAMFEFAASCFQSMIEKGTSEVMCA